MGIAIRPIRTPKEAWAESRPILRGIGLIDNLDLRSFRQPFWLAAWGAGLALAGLAFRR